MRQKGVLTSFALGLYDHIAQIRLTKSTCLTW